MRVLIFLHSSNTASCDALVNPKPTLALSPPPQGLRNSREHNLPNVEHLFGEKLTNNILDAADISAHTGTQ